MNDDALPPITVNQPLANSNSDEATPSVPDEIGNANNAATAELGSTNGETNNLDKLDSNLDEPNLADPLPVTPTVQAENSGMQEVAPEPTAQEINPTVTPSPNQDVNLQNTDNSVNLGQSSPIGRRAGLILGLLLTAIAVLFGIAAMLFYQNNLLKEQSIKLEEIEKIRKREVSVTPQPTPKSTPEPTPKPEETMEEKMEASKAADKMEMEKNKT